MTTFHTESGASLCHLLAGPEKVVVTLLRVALANARIAAIADTSHELQSTIARASIVEGAIADVVSLMLQEGRWLRHGDAETV
jgi:hypothetical protein